MAVYEVSERPENRVLKAEFFYAIPNIDLCLNVQKNEKYHIVDSGK